MTVSVHFVLCMVCMLLKHVHVSLIQIKYIVTNIFTTVQITSLLLLWQRLFYHIVHVIGYYWRPYHFCCYFSVFTVVQSCWNCLSCYCCRFWYLCTNTGYYLLLHTLCCCYIFYTTRLTGTISPVFCSLLFPNDFSHKNLSVCFSLPFYHCHFSFIASVSSFNLFLFASTSRIYYHCLL